MGTPALTSMGMKEPEMEVIAGLIDEVCKNLEVGSVAESVRAQVAELCSNFPIPGIRE